MNNCKSIYQLALELDVSKSKIRKVIIEDLKWDMEQRFIKKGNMYVINSADEDEIIKLVSKKFEKKIIRRDSLKEALARLEKLEEEIRSIRALLGKKLNR